jgi:Tfp pilus assembly protein PilZ
MVRALNLAQRSPAEEAEGPEAERRSHPRAQIRVGVRFESPADLAKAVEATTRNIGLGGLCLKTQRTYRQGDPLRLFIELGGEDALEVTAVVAWSRPGVAIGVRFDNLTEMQRAHLEDLLRRPRPHSPEEG